MFLGEILKRVLDHPQVIGFENLTILLAPTQRATVMVLDPGATSPPLSALATVLLPDSVLILVISWPLFVAHGNIPLFICTINSYAPAAPV